MPTDHFITCRVELAEVPFPEHKKVRRDRSVKCYIATPETDHPFTIHVTSRDPNGQGLAVFVFIDGVYQCNRNAPIDTKASKSGIAAEFRLRQKEEKMSDGSFIGREWSFAQLIEGKADCGCQDKD